MSWRVVVVSKRCKLEYKLGYLVCRGEDTKKVHLSEISTLIVESTAVSLTAVLLSELTENKINVVFCDEKHNPLSQLLPLHAAHNSGGKILKQIEWKNDIKTAVWTEIVRNKIWQQALFIKEFDAERANQLFVFADELQTGDTSNREGHAAKVYFNTLFGLDFTRSANTYVNVGLNYGYAVILSAFNREISASGYMTQLGLWHKNEYNPFNLSCDLMEPFRVFSDRIAYVYRDCLDVTETKRALQDMLNKKLFICGKEYSASDAITIYCKSVFDALEQEDLSLLRFYSTE